MSFMYPLGLLGLIGIPILILIYIIKSKYTEQTVASTYLWTLSQRFMKRKNPISQLTGIISLILQILSIALLSVIIAHPVFVVKDAAKEYTFVLDGSASMSLSDGESTRLSRAKDGICDLIDGAADGSVFTLVYASDVTATVYERLDDKAKAISLLSELTPSDLYVDVDTVRAKAQECFDKNNSADIYLFTDKDYAVNENVTLVNVGKGESNVGITNVSETLSSSQLVVSAQLTRYTGAGNTTVKLFIDGNSEAAASLVITLTPGESATVSLVADCEGYDFYTISIDGEDAAAGDNQYTVYNLEAGKADSICLVSDRPFFLRSALESILNKSIKVFSTEEYSQNTHGYGLYIFDSFTPYTLPTDGAVWHVNPVGSVDGSGFTVRESITLQSAVVLEKSTATASTVTSLLANTVDEDIYVAAYKNCGAYGDVYPLYTYGGLPVIFAGITDSGNRQAVFAFDLQDSNIVLLPSFVILLQNLLTYSFPPVLDASGFVAGDTVNVNTLPGMDAIRITSPSGEVSYLSVSSAHNELVADEIGTYEISQISASGERSYYFYTEMPLEERDPSASTEEAFALDGTRGNETQDGYYDDLTVFIVILCVLFIADWMVYCYEKYQLR